MYLEYDHCVPCRQVNTEDEILIAQTFVPIRNEVPQVSG
jgi:hypothetical protein